MCRRGLRVLHDQWQTGDAVRVEKDDEVGTPFDGSVSTSISCGGQLHPMGSRSYANNFVRVQWRRWSAVDPDNDRLNARSTLNGAQLVAQMSNAFSGAQRDDRTAGRRCRAHRFALAMSSIASAARAPAPSVCHRSHFGSIFRARSSSSGH